jgi:hypothetical protein
VKVKYTVLDPLEPGALTVEELVLKAENMIRAVLNKSVNKM